MLSAELGGKLPGGVRAIEDVLTSYVFDFLRYSSRTVFLKQFLQELGVRASDMEFEKAEFRFWPTFPDGTEPDVVVVVGDHYLLFEAKLFATFDPGDHRRRPQVEREIEGGLAEASEGQKQFHFIAVTADSCFPRGALCSFPQYASVMQWINWQSIARLILTLVEERGPELPGHHYARGLLAILDSRNLRGYRGFESIEISGIASPTDKLFLAAQTLAYRGAFLGFDGTLGGLPAVETVDSAVFFSREFFRGLSGPQPAPTQIFYGGA